MIRWFHHRILGHQQEWHRVTVPMFDRWSKGVLIRCDCGKAWAI